jgi:SAM-dependent methyltransferase
LIDFRLMNDQYQEADDEPNLNEFYDPRLVAIYDKVNPIAEYQTFYLDLAAKLSASSIIDIGCGTGLLACELAKRSHRLIGVEPSNAMLALARRRHYGEQVEWIEGDALRLGEVGADLAIVTGHVAQMEQRPHRRRGVLRAGRGRPEHLPLEGAGLEAQAALPCQGQLHDG